MRVAFIHFKKNTFTFPLYKIHVDPSRVPKCGVLPAAPAAAAEHSYSDKVLYISEVGPDLTYHSGSRK